MFNTHLTLDCGALGELEFQVFYRDEGVDPEFSFFRSVSIVAVANDVLRTVELNMLLDHPEVIAAALEHLRETEEGIYEADRA